ncbi:MAG: SDR family oxidoreductase [Chloroflexi bacterium]|nr:SDR family oxidoreductase [Chloroflexota bacterium]
MPSSSCLREPRKSRPGRPSACASCLARAGPALQFSETGTQVNPSLKQGMFTGMRLDDKVALIVGAGERMSRAAALLFAQEGAKVVLAARRLEANEQTRKLIEDHGGQAVVVQGDATVDADAARFVEGAVQTYGTLDILYNNVGGSFRLSGFEVADDMWELLVANNLRSIFLTSKHAVPAMVRNGGGVVLNVAASAERRLALSSAYAAAKSGVVGFSQRQAREYLNQNIRVHCICPGMIRGTFDPDALAPSGGPIARPGAPLDVAYAALYLSSDEAAWLTGAVLTVDGGVDLVYPAPAAGGR